MSTPGQKHDALPDSDVILAFDLAPVGLCVSRNRVIERCNGALAAMFGYPPEALEHKPFDMLYPSQEESDRIGHMGFAEMRDKGCYSDERIMRHHDGHLFWCHVSGRALYRTDPFACAVWMFEDLSARRPVTAALTGRERQIAQQLLLGRTSKEIGRFLSISPRTVEAHRARMMKKLGVSTPGEAISRLSGALP